MSWEIALHTAMPMVLAGFVNWIVYKKGWNVVNAQTKNKWIPPGYVVGIVWLLIFGFLGYLEFQTYSKRQHVIQCALIAYIVFCALYPFLSAGLTNDGQAKSLNAASLIFAFAIALNLSKQLLPYMFPVLLWTSYVNIVDNY